MIPFFCFFFVSGFCGLLYQVVWLRVAMADFGVTTALVSIVLSVFMAGLALGSWGGGRLVRRFENRSAAFFVRLYGSTEFAIGISGLVVAPLLRSGRTILTAQSSHAAWGSSGYYLASGGWIAIILLPFCTCMGATFPLAMAGIRAAFRDESPRSFSYLYLANVLGAMSGAFLSAFVLIELMGFSRTLLVAAGSNALVAGVAFILAGRMQSGPRAALAQVHSSSEARTGPARASKRAGTLGVSPERGSVVRASSSEEVAASLPDPPSGRRDAIILPLLFTSGLASLAMEVVWTRQFIPFLGPVVYSFATMLTVYLAATAAGSRIYRAWIGRGGAERIARLTERKAAILAGCFALLPLLVADPRIPNRHRLLMVVLRVAGGVGAFCGVLGFLTPMLVDRWSAGDPDRAGRAYAVNALGCIIGPLLSGFLLLPAMGERWTLVLLSLPFLAFGLIPLRRGTAAVSQPVSGRTALAGLAAAAAAAAASLVLILFTRDFETLYPGAHVLRDHTATVIAAGQGMEKHLLVNGVGITSLTPITKMMVHLPAASLESAPRNVLVLCFGMGTSFRSALSWGVPVTAVDLVPSVPKLFGYFHTNGDELLRSPQATVVIDDARRFLERTQEMFDVIVIDPPPPVDAAGSSLLYSREFYDAAKLRLRPGGILQQWLPGDEPVVVSAVAQALGGSFPDVRVFRSIEGWGYHFLASQTPMGRRTAVELAARVPPEPVKDLLEWGPELTAQEQFHAVVDSELSLQELIQADPSAPMLTDDRAVNEYYFLRRLHRRLAGVNLAGVQSHYFKRRVRQVGRSPWTAADALVGLHF